MSFNDTIADDASVFIDAEMTPGVESATFKPASGSSRTINVQVTRQLPKPMPGVPEQFLPDIAVFIRRHSSEGATSISTNGDRLSLPIEYGGTAVDQLITQVVWENAAGFLVKLSGT